MDTPAHYWERPGLRPHPGAPGVVTTPQQMLTGLQVGLSNLRTVCTECGVESVEGERVGVYAYRTAEARDWDVARCYCSECAPERVRTPTLGAEEAIVRARLCVCSDVGTQTHWCCLTAVELVGFSPPTEGRQP